MKLTKLNIYKVANIFLSVVCHIALIQLVIVFAQHTFANESYSTHKDKITAFFNFLKFILGGC